MKRYIAILLIVSLILSMTSCRSSDTEPEDSEKTSVENDAASPKSETYEDMSFPLKEKVTLEFLTQSSPLAPDDPNEKLIWQRFEEETNVHIDWTNYTWDVFQDKRSLVVASGDLPDAIFDAALRDYDIMKYAENGVIIPVEDLVDRYMPNLKEIYDKNPMYRRFVTAPDGHIYTFPWIEELGAGKESIHSVDCMPWINQKWLDNLGLDMPATTDELTEVLRAFKNEDANGNGDPNDEIPMSFIYEGGGEDFLSLMGAFGYGDNWDHTVVTNEGEVIFTMSQEGYKEGIKWMHQLYTEGLIDVEIFTHDWSTYVAKGSDKRYGLYFTWDMGNVTGFESGDYTEPETIFADYTAFPIPAGPNGEANCPRTNGFGLDRGRMVITSENKNLELTAMWIDKIYEPLQSAQNNWGTYGDVEQQNVFELINDGTFLKHLPLGNTSPWELRQKTFVAGPLAVLEEYYGSYVTKPDDAAWRLDILREVYVPDMKMEHNFPRVFYTAEDQETLTNIEVQMFEFAVMKVAEWITNGNIDAEWNRYLEELEAMGLMSGWRSNKHIMMRLHNRISEAS